MIYSVVDGKPEKMIEICTNCNNAPASPWVGSMLWLRENRVGSTAQTGTREGMQGYESV